MRNYARFLGGGLGGCSYYSSGLGVEGLQPLLDGFGLGRYQTIPAYRGVAWNEVDVATKKMVEEIEPDEEEHHDFLTSLFEKLRALFLACPRLINAATRIITTTASAPSRNRPFVRRQWRRKR
ncbi:MAG TPA: hypothetical protein VLV31_09525 [Candidatus Acidoferrales bacterium]|nr:hypothetical protein [Candidatus Acidoferrales bacterium]